VRSCRRTSSSFFSRQTNPDEYVKSTKLHVAAAAEASVPASFDEPRPPNTFCVSFGPDHSHCLWRSAGTTLHPKGFRLGIVASAVSVLLSIPQEPEPASRCGPCSSEPPAVPPHRRFGFSRTVFFFSKIRRHECGGDNSRHESAPSAAVQQFRLGALVVSESGLVDAARFVRQQRSRFR
jgi:hypothetical protein